MMLYKREVKFIVSYQGRDGSEADIVEETDWDCEDCVDKTLKRLEEDNRNADIEIRERFIPVYEEIHLM